MMCDYFIGLNNSWLPSLSIFQNYNVISRLHQQYFYVFVFDINFFIYPTKNKFREKKSNILQSHCVTQY